MNTHAFPVIDLIATGDNIRRLRLERGFSVRDLQKFFGFEQPQAIYKWQKGACLPTVDNLYALGSLFGVPMDQILVPVAVNLPSYIEQQAEACCSSFLWEYGREGSGALHLLQPAAGAAGCMIVFSRNIKIQTPQMETCVRVWGKGGRGMGALAAWRQGGA